MKNVLITGGVGFIGSNLAKELLKRNYNVTSIDNYSFGSKKNEIDGVDYIDMDIKTYVPTVKYLLSLNYVVVRIGDKSMPKFPYSDNNLVDLPHLSSFQDGDDVTITAFCDFYVGQNTGPIALPMFFNKDIVLTNEPNPFIGWPIDGDNKKSKMIVLFKTRLNKISKKKIPIGDFLTGQHLFKKSDFDNLGIILVENTCEEICRDSVQQDGGDRFHSKGHRYNVLLGLRRERG